MKTLAKILLMVLISIIAGNTLFGKPLKEESFFRKSENFPSKKTTPFIANDVYSFDQLSALFDQNQFAGHTSAQLKELSFSKIPTIYFTGGNSVDKTKGAAAKRLITDRSGIAQLSSLAYNLNEVEIIILKINSAGDLIPGVQLSGFSAFPQLKYIFFDYGFSPCSGSNCAQSKTIELISGSIPASLFVFYQVQTNE